MRTLTRAGAIALAGLLAATTAAAAKPVGPKPTKYVGKTSQGKRFTIQFKRVSGRERFTVTTDVRGDCVVTGLGTTTMSTSVGTGGFWTIRKGPWFFDDHGSSYDIRVGGRYPGGTPKRLSGKLSTTWQPADNVTCKTGTLTWSAKRR